MSMKINICSTCEHIITNKKCNRSDPCYCPNCNRVICPSCNQLVTDNGLQPYDCDNCAYSCDSDSMELSDNEDDINNQLSSMKL